MVLEALQGHEARIQYDIVGHSGDTQNITFVSKKNPPADNKQRLEIIKVRRLMCVRVRPWQYFGDPLC